MSQDERNEDMKVKHCVRKRLVQLTLTNNCKQCLFLLVKFFLLSTENVVGGKITTVINT